MLYRVTVSTADPCCLVAARRPVALHCPAVTIEAAIIGLIESIE
jgi:hypothetical protein